MREGIEKQISVGDSVKVRNYKRKTTYDGHQGNIKIEKGGLRLALLAA